MIIKNPYISIDISEKQFIFLKEEIRKELSFLGFEKFEDLQNPHISIAYLLGNKNISEIKSIVDDLSKDSFKMFINGINVINSEHFQGSLIIVRNLLKNVYAIMIFF